MTPDFYDLLYNGYTGEYQLMSSLYRNGLDAVRPPADMGIDVVSLNLKDQLENPDHAPETFFFQVKTAVTSIEKSDGHPGVLVTVAFKLKPGEVDLLCADASRALMCYVYNQAGRRAHQRLREPVHLLLDRRRAPCRHPRGGPLPAPRGLQAHPSLPAAQARPRGRPLVRRDRRREGPPGPRGLPGHGGLRERDHAGLRRRRPLQRPRLPGLRARQARAGRADAAGGAGGP